MSDTPSPSLPKNRRRVSIKKRKPSGAGDLMPFVMNMNRSAVYSQRLRRPKPLGSRPASIRSFSGLSGSSMVMPTTCKAEKKLENKTSEPPYNGLMDHDEYSEATVFHFGNREGQFRPAAENSSRYALQNAVRAGLVTSMMASIAEVVFALPESSHTNPFSFKSMNAKPFAAAPHGPDLVLSRGSRPFLSSMFRHSPPPPSQIISAASTTGILFGSMVYLNQQQQPTLASYATAGATVGAARSISLLFSPPSPVIPGLLAPSRTNPIVGPIVARYVFAATCYFATYDGVLSLLSQPNQTSKSTTSILAAGALAGCVNSTILAGATEQGCLRWISTCARAAPTHALVFWGYESLQRNCLKS